MFDLERPDKESMIYIFLSEDHKTMIPFKGSESEMLQLWDLLAERGLRVDRIEHQYVWTAENNPYTPLL